MVPKEIPKEIPRILNNEVRITVLRALMGLLVTASLAFASAYMAMRDQVVRSEEWIKLVGVQMAEQNKKIDSLLQQGLDFNQRLARVEGILSILVDRRGSN